MVVKKKEFVRAEEYRKITPGEMLRALRELQELTQKEVADATRISQSKISAMENEGSQIGRERALVLVNVLEVHPAVILFPTLIS